MAGEGPEVSGADDEGDGGDADEAGSLAATLGSLPAVPVDDAGGLPEPDGSALPRGGPEAVGLAVPGPTEVPGEQATLITAISSKAGRALALSEERIGLVTGQTLWRQRDGHMTPWAYKVGRDRGRPTTRGPPKAREAFRP